MLDFDQNILNTNYGEIVAICDLRCASVIHV